MGGGRKWRIQDTKSRGGGGGGGGGASGPIYEKGGGVRFRSYIRKVGGGALQVRYTKRARGGGGVSGPIYEKWGGGGGCASGPIYEKRYCTYLSFLGNSRHSLYCF